MSNAALEVEHEKISDEDVVETSHVYGAVCVTVTQEMIDQCA